MFRTFTKPSREPIPAAHSQPLGLEQTVNDQKNIILDMLDNTETVRVALTSKAMYRYFSIHCAPQILANLAGSGQPEKMIDILKKLLRYNPLLLKKVFRNVPNPQGGWTTGTYIQLAAMAGGLNTLNEADKTDDHGTVEKFKNAFVPEFICETEFTQQMEAVFPTDWEKLTDEHLLNGGFDPGEIRGLRKRYIYPFEAITAKRMENYLTALTDFARDISALDEQQLVEATTSAAGNWKAKWKNMLELPACASIIRKYRAALHACRQKMVTMGFVFSPMVLADAIDQYWHEDRNLRNGLGTLSNCKNGLFWVVGFGSLQAQASQADLLVLLQGIYQVANLNKFKKTNLQDFSFQEMALDALGDFFFLDLFGPRSARTWVLHQNQRGLPGRGNVPRPGNSFSIFCQTRTQIFGSHVTNSLGKTQGKLQPA